ncbi:FISUMP domain-containing protein [Fibrobacter sp. UWH4]|uniref:FISUMP domain-containing protein n=1 Tax=Fibrobacter sp. UWH4 TaxID=1896210 RepID=UPI00091CE56D|nr:FISUMP domain-containing protein [Fibrobacter sp. UWH4]SHK86107.1 major paralogous domain-containing protein [Fibrobacter sp. UWH4]
MKIFTLRHSWPVILEAKRRESILLAMALVFAAFTACDSGSSSADPDPIAEVSSSSDEVSKNSSSSQKSADKEKSSSSVEKSTSSSSEGEVASSSSKKDENSSSSVEKAKESSSSVNSSSSEAKSSSSEEVKQSSSSVVVSSCSMVEPSSSSEYVPYNHRRALYSDSVLTGAYKKFTDTRNGRSYYYLTINGKDKDENSASVTVMAENLNIGEMVDGEEDQNNDSKIERYCYDNDTTNCDKYGGLYQWAEMMNLPSECNTKSCANQIKPNHQGICPKGWRLLTENDFYIILHADGNRHGAEDARATSFGGYNYSGYSLLGAGYNWAYKFKNQKVATQWFYPRESVEYPEEGAPISSMSDTDKTASSRDLYKTYGASVRCVMVE